MSKVKGPKGQFAVCVHTGPMYTPSWGVPGKSLIGTLEMTLYWGPRKIMASTAKKFDPSYQEHARLAFQCDERTVNGCVGLGEKPADDRVCWYGPRWAFESSPNAARTAVEGSRLLREWPEHTHSVQSLLLMLGNVVVLAPDLSGPGYFVIERRRLVGVTPVAPTVPGETS